MSYLDWKNWKGWGMRIVDVLKSIKAALLAIDPDRSSLLMLVIFILPGSSAYMIYN
jgi:hypothetical protein